MLLPGPEATQLAIYISWLMHGIRGGVIAGVFDWSPVIVAVAAFVALWKYKADIMKVIGVCALLGLVYSLAV